MDFKFYCQYCGQHILATEDHIGKLVDCANCHVSIIVPNTKKISLIPEEQASKQPKDQIIQQDAVQLNGKKKRYALGVIAVAVMFCFTAFIFSFTKNFGLVGTIPIIFLLWATKKTWSSLTK